MARWLFGISAALALSACTSSSQAPPAPVAQSSAPDPALIASVKADREAATQVVLLCLKRAAKSLDDHKSDPMTIAHGMLSACGVELDHEVKVYSRYLDIEGEQKVAAAARQSSMDAAIQMILENRKAKK
jgi:uncharacterized protein YcfL